MLRHGIQARSAEYLEARSACKYLDPATKTGPAVELDSLIDGFHRFLTSMAGSSKEPHVAQIIVRQVRQVIEDLLAGEPYSPRLLARLQTIGDVPTGLLEKYRTGQLRGGKRYKPGSPNLDRLCLGAPNLPPFPRPGTSAPAWDFAGLAEVMYNLYRLLDFIAKEKIEEDNTKRIRNIGSYCSPGVLGRFLCSETFEDARRELDACQADPARRTTGAFCMIRDRLMLAASITNARRTGDLCNMTLQEFSTARQSRTNHSDHIVHVLRHKTAASKPCKVNFYNRLYRLSCVYIDLFTGLFLASAAVDGRVFPWVGQGGISCPMSPSQFNKAIKRVWTAFKASDADPAVPPASSITSSYLRHMFVSAVHRSVSRDQMAETAAHMSHNLSTAETHYEAHGAVELTSRSCKLFRQLLCTGNPDLSDATGLLVSSADEEDVDHAVSSPDASMNRALADRVRLMVQSERRERGLPVSKQSLTLPHGSDAS